MRALVALIVIAQAAVVVLWWRRTGGAPSWGDMCVLALMVLSALDAFAYIVARRRLFAGAWWASLALRAGQFAVPAVGLLIGFIAVAEKLREFEDELTAEPRRRARARARARGARSRSTASGASASRRACSA